MVEWVSAAAHGLGFDCGSGLEKQLGGGRISRRQYLGSFFFPFFIFLLFLFFNFLNFLFFNF